MPSPVRSRIPEPEPTVDDQGFAWLESLWATIQDRAATRPEGSYTVALLDGGVDGVGRKVTEEATEVLLAAKNDERAAASDEDRTETRALLAGEAADLVYHALVLLAERGVEPRAVVDVLRARHGTPAGHDPDELARSPERQPRPRSSSDPPRGRSG